METNLFKGVTKEEALIKAKEHYNAMEDELFYKIIHRSEDSVELEVTTKEIMINYVKEYARELLYKMNIEANFEISKLDKGCKISIYSNNDSILIGKHGRTIEALTTVIRQAVENKTGFRFNVLVDVSDYRRKKDRNIEQAALDTAREVFKTNIEATLEPMNSYQRRLVHNALNENKFVTTESIGQEPNRAVVIKPKED